MNIVESWYSCIDSCFLGNIYTLLYIKYKAGSFSDSKGMPVKVN